MKTVVEFGSVENSQDFLGALGAMAVRKDGSVAKITRKEVEHVARLARLELTEEEKGQMTAQLDAILGYFDKLNELDTSTVEPTTTVIPMVSVMREDEVRPSLPQEDALANAPDREDVFFRVPRIIED
jgi:aspartyl-tRNA(Asn)/glutamyl-tRNA(Gln) amidotransferase subunit C